MRMRLAIGLFLLATATSGLAAPRRAPAITVTKDGAAVPNPLVINAPAGGPDPAPSVVTLANSGSPKMDWTAAVGAGTPWLDVNPKSGKLNPGASIDLSITVHVTSPNVLAVGTYPGTITITAPGAGGSPTTINISLVVSSSAVITLSTNQLDFAAATNTTPAPKIVTLQNSGGSSMSWSASSTQAWIHASPSSGSLAPGASRDISVSLDAQSSAGFISGSLRIDAPGATNTPQFVTVNFTVSSLPLIGITPTTLTFDAPQGGATPVPPQFVSVTNTGGSNLNWSATCTSTPAWLSISAPNPANGTLSGGAGVALTISVNTSPGGTPLAEGTYNGSITVSGNASNSPRTVNVTLNVNTDAKITLNPKAASFTVSVDATVSAPAGISITNTGSGTLVWSAAGGPSWLGVSPSGGTLAPLASQSIILTANGAGMSPGFDTGTLQVSGTNQSNGLPASNSPQTIAVDLTVVQSTKPTDAPAGQCGLSGLEGLIPVLAFLIRRRVSKRGAVA